MLVVWWANRKRPCHMKYLWKQGRRSSIFFCDIHQCLTALSIALERSTTPMRATPMSIGILLDGSSACNGSAQWQRLKKQAKNRSLRRNGTFGESFISCVVLGFWKLLKHVYNLTHYGIGQARYSAYFLFAGKVLYCLHILRAARQGRPAADFPNIKWPYRLSVRTKPSQGLKPGSTPGRVTSERCECCRLHI